MYAGAAGVAWALDALRRRGHAETSLDLAAVAARGLERWRAEGEVSGESVVLAPPVESSLLSAETGILLVAWRLAPSAELADTLLDRVRANVDNEAEELMWGSPGTMLAAAGICPSASGTKRVSTLRARVSIRTCLVRPASPNMTKACGFSRAISAGRSRSTAS